MHVDSEKTKLFNIYLAMQETVQCSLRETITIIIIIVSRGAFHLRKKPGNFGGSKSGISDW